MIDRQQMPITAAMASSPNPFGILASQIPTERCPPLWLDKGSGALGWLLHADVIFQSDCRLFWNVWCRHALSCFIRAWVASLCMLSVKKCCLYDQGIVQVVVHLIRKLHRRSKIEPGLGSDLPSDHCVNVGTLMQHPLRLVHISPSQERTRGSTICQCWSSTENYHPNNL